MNIVLIIIIFAIRIFAGPINVNPDPDGEPWWAGGVTEFTVEEREMLDALPEFAPLTNSDLPLKIDNSELKYFRKIFMQNGASCAQAAAIGYNYTYEMNYSNDTDASLASNRYPTHYTWNFLNFGIVEDSQNPGNYLPIEGTGSNFVGGWDIIASGGIPTEQEYGGIFPDDAHPNRLWMSGYSKYESSMVNRVEVGNNGSLNLVKITVRDPNSESISQGVGIENVKKWLFDRGNGSSYGGTVVFLASVSGGFDQQQLTEDSEHPSEWFIKSFGNISAGSHAWTIVGYDDNVCYNYDGINGCTNNVDTNGDGSVDLKDWERGAFKVANSWGEDWGGSNSGFIWVPYRLFAYKMEFGGVSPTDTYEVLSVKAKKLNSTSVALRARAKINFSKRGAIKIIAGVTDNLLSEVPDLGATIEFDHFKFQGGNYGMTGKDDEPIDISLDISELLNYIDPNQAFKIFLNVFRNDDIYAGVYSNGEGTIEEFYVIDGISGTEFGGSIGKDIEDGYNYASVDVNFTPPTFYVNNDIGDDSANGSAENPFKTISRSLSDNINGTIIYLAGNSTDYPTAGTFTLTDDQGIVRVGSNNGLNISNSVTIIGENPENTIIQSHAEYDESTNRVFYVTSSGTLPDMNVSLKNLTIMNGKAENGGGIFASNISSLEIQNCIVRNNMFFDDPLIDGTGSGGAGIFAQNCRLIVNNTIISDNDATDKGVGGGLLFYPGTVQLGLNLSNSSILSNTSYNEGGGVHIDKKAYSGTHQNFNINNCTFANNVAIISGNGNAISIRAYDMSLTDINSCTIVDNFSSNESPYSSGIYFYKTSTATSIFSIKNSILANNGGSNFNSINTSNDDDPYDVMRSYTICDDYSLPSSDGSAGNHDNIPKEQIIKTDFNYEDDTYFYKIIAGSPAKDAIPIDEDDEGNPFNGAGIYVLDDEGNPILDEYGNIQVLDQRGFNVWNQRKDIGAYESPYYWVDVTEDDANYTTIPNWRTKLTIADPVEGWTDYMKAQTGGTIVLSDVSEIIRYEGSELHWYDGSYMDVEGSSRIRNGSNFIENANVNIFEGAQLSLLNSNTAIPASLNIGSDSRLILEGESTLDLDNGLNVSVKDNAELLVYGPAKLNADGVSFNYTGTEGGKWLGINCTAESFVDLNNVHISSAVTGVKGFYNNKFEITNSVFENCDNGIMITELVDNVNFVVTGNTLTGTRSGTGISITDSNGKFRENSITLFYVGANFTLCSPEIAKNTIEYNKAYGILISGQNAIPQLINTELNQVYNDLNNTVANNGNIYHGTLIFPSSQIGIRPYSNVYMQNGHNNVYRGEFNTPPAVPCISIENKVSQITSGIMVNAQNNFWGSYDVTDDFFDGHTQYSIIYEPYSANPYPLSDTNSNNPQSSQTTENKILTNAMRLEDKGNYRAAINLYELVIRKYEDSPEYYVAMARLPYLYSMLEEDNNILIAAYDEAYESENTTNKKFFKGMKVAAHIKGKRYDDAIVVAEEMKSEAEFEEEIILADINIAIANTLKNLNSKGKGKNTADDIQTLISKLTGNGEKNEPADMSETFIPEKTVLHQNYPNPFNPATQIKFDLAKTGNVKLSIYNVSGQKIAELADGIRNAGFHTVEFNGSRLNSGVYYYNLEVDGKNITKKMVLTK
jgi:hypothetical protein